ncbi:hypothetical protein ILYODFUR_024856 [Ilyodon furcidens]|uniref:Secreted protein n=1 Tax=Ilyodon furcidens TaxID=33524 RepID=A0ABV0V5W0_9TELE
MDLNVTFMQTFFYLCLLFSSCDQVSNILTDVVGEPCSDCCISSVYGAQLPSPTSLSWLFLDVVATS